MSEIEPHVSVNAVSKILGIHRNTVVKLVRAGQFPNTIRIGRVWRVSRSDLNNYMARARLTAKAS